MKHRLVPSVCDLRTPFALRSGPALPPYVVSILRSDDRPNGTHKCALHQSLGYARFASSILYVGRGGFAETQNPFCALRIFITDKHGPGATRCVKVYPCFNRPAASEAVRFACRKCLWFRRAFLEILQNMSC